MKYGEILDFRTQDKAVVGKKYVFSDVLYYISTSPENYDAGILAKVGKDENFPFLSQEGYTYQFAREIIEEKPKYRPYKDTYEMIADFSRRAGLSDSPLFSSSIWLEEKGTDECFLIVKFCESKVFFVNDFYHTMEEILNCFTYLDGSPCGIKEE